MSWKQKESHEVAGGPAGITSHPPPTTSAAPHTCGEDSRGRLSLPQNFSFLVQEVARVQHVGGSPNLRVHRAEARLGKMMGTQQEEEGRLV